MCLCFCWIAPAARYLLSVWIGVTVDTATFNWIAFGDLVDGEVGRVEVWIVSNCGPWIVLDCRVQSSEGVISLVLPAWLWAQREDSSAVSCFVDIAIDQSRTREGCFVMYRDVLKYPALPPSSLLLYLCSPVPFFLFTFSHACSLSPFISALCLAISPYCDWHRSRSPFLPSNFEGAVESVFQITDRFVQIKDDVLRYFNTLANPV